MMEILISPFSVVVVAGMFSCAIVVKVVVRRRNERMKVSFIGVFLVSGFKYLKKGDIYKMVV